jgi:hypothetical protein
MSKETAIFSVISFNLNDGLEKKDVEIQRELLKQIRYKWRNVLFMNFPEAFRPGEVDKKTVNRFARYLGHNGHTITPYKTADKRPDDHVLVTTYNANALKHKVNIARLRIATRNAVRLDVNSQVVGGKLTFIGGHLDDRREAPTISGDPTETSRLSQALALRDIIKPKNKTILAFDFNAMHEYSAQAQIARYLGNVGARWRPESVDPDPKTGRRSFSAKLFSLSEMAIGTTMNVFTEAGFTDAGKNSPYLASTIKLAPGPFGPAIDHILSNAGLKVIDFGTFRGPSDHRGIAATFEVEQTAA